jgi:hypothetical protein
MTVKSGGAIAGRGECRLIALVEGSGRRLYRRAAFA